jgi:AcrR family transcriptional regulator
MMVRTVKEHAVRHSEILDVAQRLVTTKGYEQMTIQDILDELQISKGAFYHYFESKSALLESIIERMLEEVKPLLFPILEDPDLPALQKFQRYFDTAGRWKVALKPFMLQVLRVWYADDNAIMRQKLQVMANKQIAPMLAVIVQQGIQEGVLTISYPEQVSELLLGMMYGLGDAISGFLLSNEPRIDILQNVRRTIAVYTDVMERAIGAPSGSLHLIDDEMLKEWFLLPEDQMQV